MGTRLPRNQTVCCSLNRPQRVQCGYLRAAVNKRPIHSVVLARHGVFGNIVIIIGGDCESEARKLPTFLAWSGTNA